MFRSGKFKFVAASFLCVLLWDANALASRNRDESIEEAAELNGQAILCVKHHQYDQAVELLKKAITLRPDFTSAYYNLGRIYQMRNELDPAIEAFRHAVDLKADFVEALHELGISYNRSERYGEAVECLTRAVQLQPGRADLLTELGFAYSKTDTPSKRLGF